MIMSKLSVMVNSNNEVRTNGNGAASYQCCLLKCMSYYGIIFDFPTVHCEFTAFMCLLAYMNGRLDFILNMQLCDDTRANSMSCSKRQENKVLSKELSVGCSLHFWTIIHI